MVDLLLNDRDLFLQIIYVLLALLLSFLETVQFILQLL